MSRVAGLRLVLLAVVLPTALGHFGGGVARAQSGGEFPRITRLEQTAPGTWRVWWEIPEGFVCQVERSADLSEWEPIGEQLTAASEPKWTEQSGLEGEQRVYWRINAEGMVSEPLAIGFDVVRLPRREAGSGGDPQAPAEGARFEIIWGSVPGDVYRLERSHSLDDESWAELVTLVASGEVSRHIDEIDARRTFWRVVHVGGGRGSLSIAPLEVDAQAGGDGTVVLRATVESAAPLSAVEFFNGGSLLGAGVADGGGAWSLPVRWDAGAPRVMRVRVRATPLGGEAVESEPVGMLVADPGRFVPLGGDGRGLAGALVGVADGGGLGAFAYYPEGLSDPEHSTGAHIAFGAGATLHPTQPGVVQFGEAQFHRGHSDPAPLAARPGVQGFDLAAVGPAQVAAAFEHGGGDVELLWEGNKIAWKAGALGSGGWSLLDVEPFEAGVDLPAGRLGVAVRKDPGAGESYLVMCFDGAWTTGEDGATFRIPRGDPLKLYLRSDGRLDARGTVEIVFPDGALVRGRVAWRNAVFEVSIEGRAITVPALATLRGELPASAAELLPAGADAGKLRAAAERLAGVRAALRGVATAGASQATAGAGVSDGTLAAPPDATGLALGAWAGRLASWGGDRAGETLGEAAMGDLTALLHAAGRSGGAAFELEGVLTLLRDVLRVRAALDSVLDESEAAGELRAAAAAAEARLFAVAERLVAGGLDSASGTLGDRAGLFVELGTAAAAADAGDGARAPRDGESARQQRLAALRARFAEAVTLFRELEVVRGDFEGGDNAALHGLDEDQLLERMAGVLAAMRLFGLTDVTRVSPPTPFPLHEAWEQLNDAFLAKHSAATTGMIGFAGAEELRRAMGRRARFLRLQAAFGHPRFSDSGSVLSAAPPAFSPLTGDLVAAWLDAQARLPNAVVAETCRADLESLVVFREATLDVGERIGFAALWERASACEKILTATSGSGALCAPVATALRAAGLPVEEAPAGDEGEREFRITGRYESASVAGSFPVTMQINRAGRLVLGHVHFHGGPDSPTATYRLSGMLASESPGLADYSVLLRRDDGASFLGGETWRKGFLRATHSGGEVGVELFALPSNSLLKRFVKAGNLPAQSASFRNFVTGEAQALFDAQSRAPLHRAQVRAMREHYANLRAAIDRYAAVGSTIERRAEALNVGRLLERATATVSLSQLPVARQVMCEALSRTAADLNGEEISHWTMLRIIHDQNRDAPGMEPFARFMGEASPAQRGEQRFRYTVTITDAGIGRSFFAVKGMAIEITQERLGGGGGANTFNLAGGLGQAGLSASLTELLKDLGGGAGGASAVVVSDVEYSEQSLAGPIFFMGAQAGGGVGAAEIQFGPTVLVLYGDQTLEPLIIPLPLTDGGNNLTDAGIELAMGVGFVGSASTAPPSQFSFAQGLTERKFTAEAGINGAVHFASDQHEVRVCGWSELRLLVAEMRAVFESDDGHVSILGFADATGPADPARSDDYNLDLAQARADSVRAALVNLVGEGLAVEPDRLRAIGLGRHPAMGRESPNAGQLNPAEAAFVADKQASLPTLAHGQENAGWRTVSIILNNTIRIDLNGARALSD